MKKNKLSLKKITVSNLSEDYAKRVFGGDDPGAPTYNNTTGEPPNCSDSCTDNNCQCELSKGLCPTNDTNCASGPEQPNCTRPDGGCTDSPNCPSANNKCFTDMDCSAADCTNLEHGCQPTFMDASCANGPASCNTCDC